MVQSTKKSLKEQPVDALVTLYAIACDPNCSLSDNSSFSLSLGSESAAIRHLEELQATYKFIRTLKSTNKMAKTIQIKMSKADRKNAERAAEHFAVKVLGCVKTVRAIQTQFQRQDMFGSDVIGKNKYGMSHYVQVTTGGKSAVQQRKKKMESYPWHSSDRVYVVQMEKFKEKSRVKYKFVVNELWPNQTIEREWMTWKDKTAIDKSWFKALKNSK